MDQLRDIKGLVEITFPTLWLFIGGGLILMCILTIGAYLWYRYRQHQKVQSVRKKALVALTQMDFSNAKEAAYLFTKNGYLILSEDVLHVKNFEAIVQDLEAYKFRKEVPALDDEIISRMQAFIKEANHGKF